MIDKKVSFKAHVASSTERTGTITDKVNIPVASGTHEYCPMDSYVIVEDNTNEVFIVNPICLKKVLIEKE